MNIFLTTILGGLGGISAYTLNKNGVQNFTDNFTKNFGGVSKGNFFSNSVVKSALLGSAITNIASAYIDAKGNTSEHTLKMYDHTTHKTIDRKVEVKTIHGNDVLCKMVSGFGTLLGLGASLVSEEDGMVMAIVSTAAGIVCDRIHNIIGLADQIEVSQIQGDDIDIGLLPY